MKQFTSDQFTWKGNFGTAELSSLIGKPGNFSGFSRFTIKSTKTGHTRTYELDTQSPGYEDGWDGEYNLYTDNLFDGTKVIIWNYWFALSFNCYHTCGMKTKTYKIFRDGIEWMEAEYPASIHNCKWYGIQMWNEETGFVKSAELVTGDDVRWSIEEV